MLLEEDVCNIRRCRCEEIPLIPGKGQWLCCAGAAMKRNPMSKRNASKMVGVARRHQRADRLRPQTQTTRKSDHRTTALSNSMKLSHAPWGHPSWTGHGGEV